MSNKDIIFIQGLRIDNQIGICHWEKMIRQTVVLDLSLSTNIQYSAYSEQVTDTIDYQTIHDYVISYVKSNTFSLIETLAEQVANQLIQKFQIDKIKLTVTKPGALKYAQAAGVSICRTR